MLKQQRRRWLSTGGAQYSKRSAQGRALRAPPRRQHRQGQREQRDRPGLGYRLGHHRAAQHEREVEGLLEAARVVAARGEPDGVGEGPERVRIERGEEPAEEISALRPKKLVNPAKSKSSTPERSKLPSSRSAGPSTSFSTASVLETLPPRSTLPKSRVKTSPTRERLPVPLVRTNTGSA